MTLEKIRVQIKYFFMVFLSILTAAAVTGGHFYYLLNSFVRDQLSGIPGKEDILHYMNQTFYSQIVVLLIVSAGLSIIVSFKIAGTLYAKK